MASDERIATGRITNAPPTCTQVPWLGHLHLSAGSPYFSRPFNRHRAAAHKQYIAMESLRVRC